MKYDEEEECVDEILTASAMLTDTLNAVHRYSDIVISHKEALETYKVSENNYYHFLIYLKTLDFINVFWLANNYVRIELKSKKEK